MFQLLTIPRTIVLAGAFLLSLSASFARADDPLTGAAARFRDKEYGDAYSQAQKAADTPQRTFLMGVAALRLGRQDDAVRLLAEAERRLPLVGDYAALYQAEALLKGKRYTEAAAKAYSVPKAYPASQLVRRSEKLMADIYFEAADYKGALKLYMAFVERYASGSDSVDALFQAARCREETGDKGGAVQGYRTIWLNNPAAPQARKAQERLRDLDKGGARVGTYTPEELLRRAAALYAQNEFGQSLQTLQSISLEGQSDAFVARVDLRTGLNRYRQRSYKQAEKSLTKAAASTVPAIRSEARFWLAKTLERQEQYERAFSLFMELAGEGKRQEFADDALMEAAGLRKSLGSFTESARICDLVIKGYPGSRFVGRAAWEAAWCRYLGGEYAPAAEAFKGLLKDDTVREKALYWLARSLENAGSADAAGWYRTLLEEYPAGFYASWYREQRGSKDLREPLGRRNALAELPVATGFEKPRLLASVGMMDEARTELAAARRKMGDKGTLFPALARLYLEMGDYGSAITLFLQNRPVKWDSASLPLWTAGYPLAYTGPVSQYAAANELSEALVYSLIRAESGFSAAVRSHAGAIGLMQLMPDTARATIREKGAFDPLRLTVPEFNIKVGTRHLRELLKGYDGDAIYAVAAYNAGATAVDRWRRNMKGLKKDEFIESIPYLETRDYVKKVYAAAATYRQLYGLR